MQREEAVHRPDSLSVVYLFQQTRLVLHLCHTNTSILHTASIQTMEYETSSKSENYNVPRNRTI